MGEVRVYRSTGQVNSTKSFLQLVSHTPPLQQDISFFAAQIYAKLLRHRTLAPKVMKQTKLRVALPLCPLYFIWSIPVFLIKPLLLGKRSHSRVIQREVNAIQFWGLDSFVKFLLCPWFSTHLGSGKMKSSHNCLFCASLQSFQIMISIFSKFSNSLMLFFPTSQILFQSMMSI